MTSFGSLKRLFACLSVPREVVSYLLSGSFDLSFQICALGHDKKSGLCTKRDKKEHLCDLIVISGQYPSLDKQNVNMHIATAKLH